MAGWMTCDITSFLTVRCLDDKERLSRKSVVRLTDRPDMTLDVYRGRKTTIQQQQQPIKGTCAKHTYKSLLYIKYWYFYFPSLHNI